ncbi:synaptojanin-1-like isoform X2 [Paramacrobiotus metropolitanus]|uniref:synaptojanin-1-like isoform X2 n=1 Tax=Paramacrobiotus metropolitanus TaxID=2943436 RepID=UPI002445DB37|nr:synaptojanin-1-like isoform X2 [Paramacrobiotus metropolitanus]
MVLGKHFKIYHKPADQQRPFTVVVENRDIKSEALYFESGVATTLSYEDFEHLKPLYAKICDAYALLGVLTYNAGHHRILYLVVVSSCVSIGKLSLNSSADSEILRIAGVTVISLRNDPGDEERLVEFVKLLSSGIFYFAVSLTPNAAPLDLTVCCQRATLGAPTDNRFFWNRGLHLYVQSFGISCDKWLVKIICGGVEIKTLYVAQYQARVGMISRFNSYRAGTRFQVRGANDDGNVANFVETEQIVCIGDQITSYVQIRGSVPLFWEQTGVQVGAHKISYSRSYETMSAAFDRHLIMLKREYGDQILLNLLGSKEGEKGLTEKFRENFEGSAYRSGMLYIHYDYHANVRGGRPDALIKELKDQVMDKLLEFGFFHASQDGIKRQQNGAARTNCLDCLDRTNAVQTFLGLLVLQEQMQALGISDKPQVVSRFEQLFAQLWQQNGDHVSRIYAGTSALEGKSKIKDGARSVSRTVQNNLFDTSKKEAMDILLAGALLNSDFSDRARTVLPFNLRQVPAFLLNSLFNRAAEYTHTIPLTFWVGTWNVNGGKSIKAAVAQGNKERPIDDWILDCAKISQETKTNYLRSSWDPQKPVDIFAIGFEEIVDLNASNIMAASTVNQRQWFIDISAVLKKVGHYVLVQSVQLVGVCLFVFIRAEHVPHLRDVATAMVKTGMGGVTGNKGGVAIRFQLYNSSICFCCSHFAAGQSNVNERNADFLEISNKLVFPAELNPHSHDFVFWCGDFNYRIDMENELVRDYIKNEKWPQLSEGDQLLFSKKHGKCFQEYSEAPVLFAPTYKYDPLSDDYDTSEKFRCPAWTDRVLVRGRKFGDMEWNDFNIVYYGRMEIRTSDHRPVSALVEVDVHVTDAHKCEEVLNDILDHLGPSDGTVLVSLEDPDAIYAPEMYQQITSILASLGEILMIRYSGSNLCITFSTGHSALSALNYDGTDIFGKRLSVKLRLEDWRSVLDLVVNLSKHTATALCDTGEPLLLDENEIAMRVPMSHPSTSGLNDLDLLTGEEGKDGKDFAGSVVNMATSEAADLETASLHSNGSDNVGAVTPPIVLQKVAPPRPPPARPPPAKIAPKQVAVDPWAADPVPQPVVEMPTKSVPTYDQPFIDPWAAADQEAQSVTEIPFVQPAVAVQPEILVATALPEWPAESQTAENANGLVRNAESGPAENEFAVPPSSVGSLPSGPPPPPPRRRVGQKLPDSLIKLGK